jgi:hypothetical protein
VTANRRANVTGHVLEGATQPVTNERETGTAKGDAPKGAANTVYFTAFVVSHTSSFLKDF